MIVDYRKIFVWLGNMNDQGRWGKMGTKLFLRVSPRQAPQLLGYVD